MKCNCERCGEQINVCSWEQKLCYSCVKKKHAEEIKDSILHGGEVGTDCEDEIYCPYCGEEVGLEPCDDGDVLYTEGDHEVECPHCERLFVVNTTVHCFYDTRRI